MKMETKRINFKESTIPAIFKQIAETEVTTTLSDGTAQCFTISMIDDERNHSNDSTDAFGVVMTTIANIMSRPELKPEEGKSALVFNNFKGIGEMVFACIAELVEDEGEKNWMYRFSFNPDDIKGIKNENIFSFTSLEKVAPYATIFNEVFLEMHSKRIPDVEIINQITLAVIKCITNWLDTNASETEIVEIQFTDCLTNSNDRTKEEYLDACVEIATFSVAVEKGIKVMSGSFGEELKAIAKGNGDNV